MFSDRHDCLLKWHRYLNQGHWHMIIIVEPDIQGGVTAEQVKSMLSKTGTKDIIYGQA